MAKQPQDEPLSRGGHVARHSGKGRTSSRLMNRPDLKRADSAAPVGGETAAALKQALERSERR
jgi:hypothetical protein